MLMDHEDMPPFMPNDPELWFHLVESTFEDAGIDTDHKKFCRIVCNLDMEHVLVVRDVVTNPPDEGRYAKLKSEIIKRMAASHEKKTRQQLERERIGERTPSQFLRLLRRIAGTVVPDSDIRVLWLKQLPDDMKAFLVTRGDGSLDELAVWADAIAQQERASDAGGASAAATATASTSRSNDCTICCENIIDAVLYKCGHMSMCFECAKRQRSSNASGQCPICRAPILDIIKVYK